MQVWFFGAASLVNALALCVHVFAGGRQFVRPLLASSLEPEIRWMAYFMWHVATVAVGATAILFAIAALIMIIGTIIVGVFLCPYNGGTDCFQHLSVMS